MAMVQCPECKGEISDKAYACPHCGYPIREKETKQDEYVLTKGGIQGSSLSGLLRVLAVITWIGGIIIAISGAQVMDSLYSSHFSFAAFLTLLIPYVIYGIIMWGMATLADQISDTYSIVSGIKLDRISQGKSSKSSGSYSSSSSNSFRPAPKTGDWVCPVCRTVNHSWNDYCSNCSEPKKR